MELLFLGTGAADWNISKRVEGEFFRRFSSALVDGALLIDPGPHIFDFAEKNGTPELFRSLAHSAQPFMPGSITSSSTKCGIWESSRSGALP